MRKTILLNAVLALSILSGCAFFDRAFPHNIDPATNTVLDTRTVDPAVQAVAAAFPPYGDAAVALILLISNLYTYIHANKNKTALAAVVAGVEQALNDPSIIANADKLKTVLQAHQTATGSETLVKSVIDAVAPTVTTSDLPANS